MSGSEFEKGGPFRGIRMPAVVVPEGYSPIDVGFVDNWFGIVHNDTLFA